MPAALFNSRAVKILKDILAFKNDIVIMTGDTDDPTSVAKDAPASSLYLRSGTDEVYVKQDSGSSTNWTQLSTGGSGANTALSNLTTTSINQPLLPNADGTRDLGSSTLRWQDIFPVNIKDNNDLVSFLVAARELRDNNEDLAIKFTAATRTLTDSGGLTALNFTSGLVAHANFVPNANNTRDLGTTSVLWRRAYLRAVRDTNDVDVLDVDNKEMNDEASNLAIAFNSADRGLYDSTETKLLDFTTTDLVVTGTVLRGSADNTVTLGSDSERFATVKTLLIDGGDPTPSISVNTRQLIGPDNNSRLDWSGTDLDINTRKITNVVDPTSAQHAATKNYVDTTTLTKSTGDINQTSFSAANNQASPANVTGFAFANANVRSFKALVSIHIDATVDLDEVVELTGVQAGGDWYLSPVFTGGDTSGVEFSITSAGQVQYTSTNVSGFVSSTIKFRAITTAV